MRPAPLFLGTIVLLGSLALSLSAAGAGKPCPPAKSRAAGGDPAPPARFAPPEAPASLYAPEVPLSEAGSWDVTPRLSRRLVQVSPGVFAAVKGEHERRHVRVARWIRSLKGDPREVFQREGMPVYRHRELADNHLFEYWTYPERNLTFVFEKDRLLRTQPF